jgi:hypothetical protein
MDTETKYVYNILIGILYIIYCILYTKIPLKRDAVNEACPLLKEGDIVDA